MCLRNSQGGGQDSASAESNKFMEETLRTRKHTSYSPLDVRWIWRVGPGSLDMVSCLAYFAFEFFLSSNVRLKLFPPSLRLVRKLHSKHCGQ